ncbi:valine--tRNA ligase [Dehalogenimonas etheniformans]|uniref:Valine--tRNA ligase n=1 Tax=Dehalogenimonas etheniformans TaxID=1536648 RepID=A0A2P5P8W8_9CHLR|nr:valine--tRNA ligase [Dehalogenimonas etheniformans]PPD58752.1 valine--tRNA ligase [Dehalogenimonas etheniformans]QNT76477.1 valine--tRNA ligase [Dehalogenimonas etheniformans]
MTDAPMTDLPKAYEPAQVEDKWYQFWMERGYFKPAIDPNRKPFVIIMPPPNVTGELHLGHALTATLEDIMIRWHRMKGEPTLWLPGVDHAGIAAQVVVERALAKEHRTKYDLGREAFTKRMWEWANSCRSTIRKQHMRLGASCDWDREVFTLDAGPSLAVRTTFKNLYDKDLIYRGERIINWCPRCHTAISDLEVDHKDLSGHLWHIKYPLADNPEKFVTVATTRPETMLGDVAVAVNPDDERYKGLVGKKLMLPLMDREIPIIADSVVDMTFGTGAVKTTPAHDPTDFEIAQRHNLPLINIFNDDATLNKNAGRFAGIDRYAARKLIAEELAQMGLLALVQDYTHSVGHCQRCATVAEPIASRQWFVKMAPLAKPALEVVTSGQIKILPERFEKVYLNWMENIRDWCISRQLWWGHRIPVWYCKCGEVVVSVDSPTECPACHNKDIEQDPDVLDTWFSSGLWPHSTLGWPNQTEDLKYFYPTSVMETGYDILFFWVARMITMGLENTGKIPFDTVYLHGLIRDEKGEKMSKVKGNVMNPLTLIDNFGTDALRFGITTGNSPGNDIKLSENRLEAGRNFANKLFNAARFVIGFLSKSDIKPIDYTKLPVEDRWILSRLSRTEAQVASFMNDFQFGEAERELHDFIWGEFCDWYIELAKIRLQSGSEPSPLPVLLKVLDESLRLLHPFMPFITEELWQHLRQYLVGAPESIMVATYPTAHEALIDPISEEVIEGLTEVVRAIRNVRAEHKVEAGRWITAELHAGHNQGDLIQYRSAIETLGRVRPLSITADRFKGEGDSERLVLVLKNLEVVLPLSGMIDLETESKRQATELAETITQVERLRALLASGFASKAPSQVVAKEKARLEALEDKLRRLKT